jgi:D-galactarolactone cycloisomerase
VDRRGFHKMAVAAGLALPAAAALGKIQELRITRVLLQRAQGRRLTPVAPNAFAAYRGYGAIDPVLRLQTAQGLEGIGCYWGPLEALGPLIGLDPFVMFEWEDDRVRGVAEPYRPLLARLAGADVALFDLLGKRLGRPIADLLGPRVRESVMVYDSSLYMEDLLTPEQREGLAYLEGEPPPQDPAEMVGRKAAWLISRPGGIRIFKVKLGRVRWMGSFDAALARDIAVVRAVRRAMGNEVTLLVDGNNGYRERPLAAADLALATAAENVHAMEEMFDEEDTDAAREAKRRLRSAGLAVRLADGETHPGGIPAPLLAERFTGPDGREEPLYDIDQPDMNTSGYARMLEVARDCARLGVALAPHNFGSKLGFWSQVHLGLVTPGWAFSESDDSAFPALQGDGFHLADGQVSLTGLPGLGVRLDTAHLDPPLLDLTA